MFESIKEAINFERIYAVFTYTTNEWIIVLAIFFIIFAIVFDIFYRTKFFNKNITFLLSLILSFIGIFSGITFGLIHFIFSLGISIYLIIIFGTILFLFINFALIHLGIKPMKRINLNRGKRS